MPVKERFVEMLSELIEWRHDLHRHPELMFDLPRTSSLVAERLRDFGCDEVVTGIARTGVVAVVKGQSTSSGKVVGLRADMDALPIHEGTGVEYASTIPGVMHACGHDGHTVMLLGTARYLCETRNFNGTAVLIFQPAEEDGGGGKVMCDEGIMDRWDVQEVYSMHNWCTLELGEFAIRSGAYFASSDEFEIVVNGHGGHAASPHRAVDPVTIASQLVTALQTVVSRNISPVDQVVLSVTSLETSTKAYNVIPDAVTIKGTLRAFSEANRERAEKRLRELTNSIAEGFGGSAEINYMHGYPPMVNSKEHTEYAISAAEAVSGSCSEGRLVMGSEDFSYMLQHRPGAYIVLGMGRRPEHHTPDYDFNDATIPYGCSWYAELIEQRLPA